MSRILILANDNSTIYNFRRELIAKLISEKYQVYISVPKHERNKVFQEMGCTIDEIDISRSGTNPIKELGVVYKYKQQIKRLKPDVVLTYTAKPNIYGSLACQLLDVPYINNVTGLGSVFQSENFLKRIMLLLQKQAYKKSTKVFFQNKYNKDYFEEKGVVKKNGALLPGSGVNLELHKYESYPDNKDIIRFILVSRVRKDKGFDELFEAIKIISNEFSNIEFHLVGWYEDENYKAKIDEMVQYYSVIYHGNQSQEGVHELMAYCHCLVHPSYHEGMANVLLEAAATGRPCLASNIPGCKETIDDEISGFLFKVQDSKSLALSIKRFIKLNYEEKKKMGIAGRAKVEKEFDRNIVINEYMKAIESILEEGGISELI